MHGLHPAQPAGFSAAMRGGACLAAAAPAPGMGMWGRWGAFVAAASWSISHSRVDAVLYPLLLPTTHFLSPASPSPQPAADIAEICELARARGVAVVFALNRIGLGSVFGTNKRMSGGCGWVGGWVHTHAPSGWACSGCCTGECIRWHIIVCTAGPYPATWQSG